MSRFRNATRAELGQILGWAAEEGWNPGRADADAFFAADPEGFFIAEDARGSPIASISVVNHSPTFAFLGLYIVRPAHRGQGIGIGLWHHALAHAGDRVVGLDGVEAQQDNYAASGFVHAGGTTRFTGQVAGETADAVRLAREGDLPQLLDREADCSGTPKPAYLTAWFSAAEGRVTLVKEEHGQITGFCTVRACHEGAKIGPLVAQDERSAADLIQAAAHRRGGLITIDVPQTAAPLVALCHAFGLAPGFKTARMYRGAPVPEGRGCAFFAVSSLELG